MLRGTGVFTTNRDDLKSFRNKKLMQYEEGTMDKYRCMICDYIYDPALGDPGNGIEPGTSFDDLPDDWLCPICGVGKDSFEKI